MTSQTRPPTARCMWCQQTGHLGTECEKRPADAIDGRSGMFTAERIGCRCDCCADSATLRAELERVTKERDGAREFLGRDLLEARDRIETLELENGRLRADSSGCEHRAESAEAQVAALKADLAAAEKAVDDFEEERDRARADNGRLRKACDGEDAALLVELERKTRALETIAHPECRNDKPRRFWCKDRGCPIACAALATPTEGEKP